jgi:membrane protease YdiL (CAAX protease family)
MTNVTTFARPFKKNASSVAANMRPLFAHFWIFAWIIVAVAAAQLSLFGKPVVGVYVNAAAFASLIALALWQERARQLATSVAILPVATMVNLSLPQTSAFAQAVVFYDSILILALIYRFAFTIDFPLSNTRLSLRGYAFALPLMLVAGQVLGTLGFVLLRHQYAYGNTPLSLVAAVAVLFAISEEMLFRGLIQQRATQLLHPALAAALSALTFAAFTFGHTGSYLSPLFGLILGLALAATYYKKQNLILTITINAATKLAYVGLIAGFIFH